MKLSIRIGATLLSGVVADQATIHDLLERIRNFNLYLISFTSDVLPSHSPSQNDLS